MPPTNPARYVDPRRATRTRQETGRLVGCSPNMVDKLIERDVVDAVEVGCRKLVTVVSIERLLGRPIAELEAGVLAVHDAAERGRAAGLPPPEPAAVTARGAQRQLSKRGAAPPS